MKEANIWKLLTSLGIANSLSEARRLVESKVVSIDGVEVTEPTIVLAEGKHRLVVGKAPVRKISNPKGAPKMEVVGGFDKEFELE